MFVWRLLDVRSDASVGCTQDDSLQNVRYHEFFWLLPDSSGSLFCVNRCGRLQSTFAFDARCDGDWMVRYNADEATSTTRGFTENSRVLNFRYELWLAVFCLQTSFLSWGRRLRDVY